MGILLKPNQGILTSQGFLLKQMCGCCTPPVPPSLPPCKPGGYTDQFVQLGDFSNCQPPTTFTVAVAGIAGCSEWGLGDPGCDCGDFNGTHVLEHHSEHCHWAKYSGETFCLGGPSGTGTGSPLCDGWDFTWGAYIDFGFNLMVESGIGGFCQVPGRIRGEAQLVFWGLGETTRGMDLDDLNPSDTLIAANNGFSPKIYAVYTTNQQIGINCLSAITVYKCFTNSYVSVVPCETYPPICPSEVADYYSNSYFYPTCDPTSWPDTLTLTPSF